VGEFKLRSQENVMKKHIIRYSYWLGVLSVLLSLLTRVLNMFGLTLARIVTRGSAIDYHTFLDSSQLFFLMAIATASYVWFKSQKDQL
jgi:hypothetical protein